MILAGKRISNLTKHFGTISRLLIATLERVLVKLLELRFDYDLFSRKDEDCVWDEYDQDNEDHYFLFRLPGTYRMKRNRRKFMAQNLNI